MINCLTKINSSLKFLLFILFITQTYHTNASHIMGSDISWKSMGNHKYEITLRLYRDCRGIPAYSDELNVKCASGTSANLIFKLNRIDINDITKLCDTFSVGHCDPPNTYTSKPGIEEHIFKGILDFNSGDLLTMRNNGCCRFNLAFSECCRNQNFGMTIQGGNFFTDAEIDLCNIDKSSKKFTDNSPVFSNPPIRHVCINSLVTFSNGSIETDGDSLTFTLVGALSQMNVNVNYNNPFSATWPMTSYCDTNSIPCNCDESNFPLVEGFCFKNNTGEMSFIPTEADQSGVIVVKIEQFRLDSSNNQWMNIGFVKREIQLVVLMCNENNPPYLNKLEDTMICAGDTICVDIKAMDLQYSSGQLWNDSVTLTWDEGIPGASFIVGNQYMDTINGEVFVVKDAEICWETSDSLGRSAPYLFSVTARDKACPYNAISTRSYSIKVDPCLPLDTNKNSLTLKVIKTLTVFPNPVNNILTIESELPIKSVKIYDNQGKLVLEKIYPVTLDFSNFSSGIYLIYGIDLHGNILMNKVVKE